MLLLFRYANWSRQRHIFPPITFTKNLQLRIASFTPRRINKIIKMLPYTVHTKPVWADSWLLQILVSIIDLRSYSYNPPPPPPPFFSLPLSGQISNIFFKNMRFKDAKLSIWRVCLPTSLSYFWFDHCDQIDFIKNCQTFKKQNTMKLCNNILL